MSTFIRIALVLLVALNAAMLPLRPAIALEPPGSGKAYGLSRYADERYGFSFWYPSVLEIRARTDRDKTSFPGGLNVKTLQVGEPGAVSISVVISPKRTITDEPNGHASPIGQTKYFYDARSKRWMVAFPEGSNVVGEGGSRPADISEKTMGGLLMLASGARFDATIIPLSTSLFLVVKDGGGSGYTKQLAKTIAPAGARIDPSTLSAVMKAEAEAYARQ